MSFTDLVREVMSLTGNVERMEKTIDRLEDRMYKLTDRVVRLEGSSEVTLEKAKNASLQQMSHLHGDIIQRLVQIETQLENKELKTLSSRDNGTNLRLNSEDP